MNKRPYVYVTFTRWVHPKNLIHMKLLEPPCHSNPYGKEFISNLLQETEPHIVISRICRGSCPHF